jgi:hypothetical protein
MRACDVILHLLFIKVWPAVGSNAPVKTLFGYLWRFAKVHVRVHDWEADVRQARQQAQQPKQAREAARSSRISKGRRSCGMRRHAKNCWTTQDRLRRWVPLYMYVMFTWLALWGVWSGGGTHSSHACYAYASAITLGP